MLQELGLLAQGLLAELERKCLSCLASGLSKVAATVAVIAIQLASIQQGLSS